MSVTLPGTGEQVETIDSVGTGKRQVVALGALGGGNGDPLAALATQTTLAAVLAKLSADPATQTTLAAILAKLIAAPATEAKQDSANTALASIASLLTTQAGYLDGIEGLIGATNGKDFATQTTLAAVLAALVAAQPAGENHIGEVGGNTAVAGGSMTRQANTTAYASGQHIAAAAAAAIPCAVARKNAGTGVITGLRLSKSSNTLTNASFRVHLFKTAPATLPADAAAFAAGVSGVAAVALGYVDITMDQQYSDGAKGFASLNAKAFDAAAGSPNIYALIEARAAYTPASAEVFTVVLEALRD